MANCVGCGRELSALSTGDSSTLCAACLAAGARPAPPLTSVPGQHELRQRLTPTIILLGINVGVFVLMALRGVSPLEPTREQLLQWGANWGPLSLGSEPWRMLTSNYVHIGILHIFFNMWCLLNLGKLAERMLDRWTYLATYTLCGLAGSLASLWWHPMVVGAGASGAIFGLAGALIAVLYLGKSRVPQERIRPMLKSLLIFAGYNLFLGLSAGIDNSAHIGGLVAGLTIGGVLAPHLAEGEEERKRWRNFVLAGVGLVLIAGNAYVRQHAGVLPGAR